MTGSITQLLTDIPALFSDSKLFVAAAASESQSSSSDIKAAPRSVLVIDDERSIADSLTEILVAVGYDAFAFYNGHAAIEFARKKCPDIVLSDVVMPKLNGVETVLTIREACPFARILLFSGQATTSDILHQARAKGHEFDVLPKPIHPDVLLTTLSQIK